MHVGAVFPQLEIGTDPNVIAKYARTVEDLGYEHLVIFDHVLGADSSRPEGWTGVYDHRSMFHEPFVLFGYLAAITNRLKLATAVIVLPQRQTPLVAKQAAEVDVLSRGRLILGVGIGWNEVEYEALGMSFTNRGKRIEEQIAVLRALWMQEVVDFNGRWHRIDRAGINPLPVQRPIPIWMGGGWDRQKRTITEPALRRIAKIADGWFTHLPPNEDGRAGMEAFRRLVQEEGRDPAKVPVEGRLPAAKSGPDDWKRGIDTFQQMGMTSVELNTMGAGYRRVDEHLDALRRFRELIQPSETVASGEVEHRRHSGNAAPDPGAIEAALRREARDVYGWSNAPGDTYGEHEHGYTKVLYCTRGSIDFVLAEGKRVAMKPGDRLVLPPLTRHSALVGPEGCACVEGKLPP